MQQLDRFIAHCEKYNVPATMPVYSLWMALEEAQKQLIELEKRLESENVK